MNLAGSSKGDEILDAHTLVTLNGLPSSKTVLMRRSYSFPKIRWRFSRSGSEKGPFEIAC